ncbi:putative serine/threonine/dual specificity protein kinase, catalytic domain-containing protein [Tanacetum coccineum]
MSHLQRAIMEEHRASMEAYKKVHNETVISELRMIIVQQSMEMDMWEIKEKLAERREQMAIRAYEKDKRREEWIQQIEEDKRLTTKVPAVTATVPAKPIQNSPRFDDLSNPNKKTTKKGVGKEWFGCALNKSKGSHLGLRHCAANRKRNKRKEPFVWTKSKSRVVIEVGQTKAIDGGLNCDNRLANYEQPCQHFLMFDYDPQEGELQVKTWYPGKILEQHLEDKDLSKKNHHPELVKLNSAFKLAEKWVSNMTKTTDDKSTRVVLEARPPRLGIGAVVPRQPKVGLSNDPVERKLRAQVDAGKQKYSKIEEESRLNPKDDVTSDEDDESESRTKTFVKKKASSLPSSLPTTKKQ